MITSIQIENLRGIRQGELPKLAPLTVLTGPNGCGKSTILDALLMGGSPVPELAVGIAVHRHQACPEGARWLLTFGAETAKTKVVSEKQVRERSWFYVQFPPPGSETRELAEQLHRAPFRMIVCREHEEISRTYFAADNFYKSVKSGETAKGENWVHIIDPGSPIPLDRRFSEAIRHGNQDEIESFVRPLVPGMAGLAILTEEDGTAQVYVQQEGKGGARPVSLSGDGIFALVQTAIELGTLPQKTVALIEEPEVFSHPRSLVQVARALVAAVLRGVQIVTTTHSLELIDELVVACGNAGIRDQMAVINLALVEGSLRKSYLDGDDILAAREILRQDLR